MRTAPKRSVPFSWRSRDVSLALLLAAAGAARADGEARGRIIGERVVPAVVYAEDLPDETAPAQARATMRQLNLHFVPQVLPVLQGTTVEFNNEDATAHNVFSPSPPAFDLGTFGGGTRSFLFRAPGPHVILCNVHLEMVAWVLVLRNPFFASVDEDGRFSLKLPPGRRRLVLWRPRERDVIREVDVPKEGRTEFDWVLSHRRL
jgi:plastocyanin